VAKCAPDGPHGFHSVEENNRPENDECCLQRGCALSFNADGTLWTCAHPGDVLMACSQESLPADGMQSILQQIQQEWEMHCLSFVSEATISTHVGGMVCTYLAF
jgi:hypothetical protein